MLIEGDDMSELFEEAIEAHSNFKGSSLSMSFPYNGYVMALLGLLACGQVRTLLHQE
jgi:hypothetical protein